MQFLVISKINTLDESLSGFPPGEFVHFDVSSAFFSNAFRAKLISEFRRPNFVALNSDETLDELTWCKTLEEFIHAIRRESLKSYDNYT
jgi:hypothetical protein